MLELKNITKYYETGEFKQMALNGISLKFVPGDIVSILGPSGCGKTTLLNIIGGLDRYTSGDLIINGVSTKKFKDQDWDAYRNNSIGFVFQSYNLINHISVLDNVEMALTLSGVSQSERKTRAIEVLEQVGLSDHLHKRPNQLSGGQKQRVAIARAIVNDPDIILMDEPTGALDSKTSVQILELVKEIAKGKLVIMVTHNPTLAEQYSTRIIKLHDGAVIDDSKPPIVDEKNLVYNPKKTSMSFWTALKLSFNNLRTKLGRSLITSFAASIGIIGVALVLAISNGFNNEISNLEKDTLAGMPITINRVSYSFDAESFRESQKPPVVPEGDFIVPVDKTTTGMPMRRNKITQEYLDFILSLESGNYYESVVFEYEPEMYNLMRKDEAVVRVNANQINFTQIPGNRDYILDGFEIVKGDLPTSANQIVLVTDQYRRIDQRILIALGIDTGEEVAYDSIIGTKLVAGKNNDYFYLDENVFKPNSDLNHAYENGFELEVVGIIKPSKDLSSMLLQEGVAYHKEFADAFLENSLVSEIVEFQKTVDYDVLSTEPFNPLNPNNSLEVSLLKLGGTRIPSSIKIYAADFDAKKILKTKLNEYNEGIELDEDQIVYSDLTEQFASSISTIIDSISIVLIAFGAISLVVSSIMIGIITYVSVLERTKEIGVLRSLGARKKDISRVFNAETFLIGLVAGLLGVGISYLLTIPLNIIFSNALSGMMSNIADLSIIHALALVAISVVLTLISGLIPARMAAKKDPVEALRMEA